MLLPAHRGPPRHDARNHPRTCTRSPPSALAHASLVGFPSPGASCRAARCLRETRLPRGHSQPCPLPCCPPADVAPPVAPLPQGALPRRSYPNSYLRAYSRRAGHSIPSDCSSARFRTNCPLHPSRLPFGSFPSGGLTCLAAGTPAPNAPSPCAPCTGRKRRSHLRRRRTPASIRASPVPSAFVPSFRSFFSPPVTPRARPLPNNAAPDGRSASRARRLGASTRRIAGTSLSRRMVRSIFSTPRGAGRPAFQSNTPSRPLAPTGNTSRTSPFTTPLIAPTGDARRVSRITPFSRIARSPPSRKEVYVRS